MYGAAEWDIRPDATPVPYLMLADVHRMCSTCDEKWNAAGSTIEAMDANSHTFLSPPKRP